MKPIVRNAAIVAVLLTVTAASAQEPVLGPCGYAVRPMHNGTPAINHHASTFEEGYLRGQADYLRAQGDYLYGWSLYMINLQEARHRYIANQLYAAEAFHAKRAAWRDARRAEWDDRPTREDCIRIARMRAGTHR